MHTPWGTAQTKTPITRGIIEVTTASHGGIHVSPAMNNGIHPEWRQDDGWYEEDCDWSIVALTWPQHFKPERVQAAHTSAKNWHPDGYEAVFGVKLTAADSHERRRQEFETTNADRYKHTAAWGPGTPPAGRVPVPDGVIGVCAGKGPSRRDDERWFLIPEDEWRSADRTFGFVIDESRHGEWPAAEPAKTVTPPADARPVVALRASVADAKRHFEAGGAVLVSERGHEPTITVGPLTTTHDRTRTTWDELATTVAEWRGRYPNQRYYLVPETTDPAPAGEDTTPEGNTTMTETKTETETVELVRLPHSGVQVPHDRFSLADVILAAGFFDADLLLDGKRVAKIAGPDCDGTNFCTFEGTDPTKPDSEFFGRYQMDEFTRASRDEDGDPISESDLFDAFIEEHTNREVITRYAEQGKRTARKQVPLPGSEGQEHYTERHVGVDAALDQEAVVLLLASDHPLNEDEFWQLWNGREWLRLPAAAEIPAADDSATDDQADELEEDDEADEDIEDEDDEVDQVDEDDEDEGAEHKLELTKDDKYEHLSYGHCTCMGWRTSGAMGPDVVRNMWERHIVEVSAA